MELISYAIDFTSFLIQNLKNKSQIKTIILFGSAAREEAREDSDVDIFIDIYDGSLENELEKEVKAIKNKFFNSMRFNKYWKLLNVKNEMNVIVGVIDKWKLKNSLPGNALILYQQYSPKLDEGKNKAILSWENVKPDSKRVMLSKKLFGYKHYKHYYEGILKNYNAQKLGSNVIILDADGLNEVLKVFRHFNVAVKISRVFEYVY
jgi:predicted nucleotidyltransferase